MNIVILAAGKGTRMKSDLPKVLQPLAAKPILQHIVDNVAELKSHIYIVIGHGAQRVKDTITTADSSKVIHWVIQDKQLGTGHAVDCALQHIDNDEPCVILNGDVPLVSQESVINLADIASKGRLGLITAILDDPAQLGRIVRDDKQKILAIREYKDANDSERGIKEINSGIIAAPIKKLKSWLSMLKNDNAQGEYYLTDIFGMAAQAGEVIESVLADNHLQISGVNSKLELSILEQAYQQQQANDLLMAGLHIIRSDQFMLRGSVKHGTDCTVDVNCVMEGQVTLGDRVHIEPNVCLKNCHIGNDVIIKANSHIDDAIIGDDCQLGPYARIRPNTKLQSGAKVGNFVEIKSAEIGVNTKINHLSYIGDAQLGANVNVGAGTITCNYDGANKHKTVIGDDVQIGSDCQLVAPLTIAQGSTVGAGTTVMKNVSSYQLVINEKTQREIDGWKRPTKTLKKD